jgi:hypothetical protein
MMVTNMTCAPWASVRALSDPHRDRFLPSAPHMSGLRLTGINMSKVLIPGIRNLRFASNTIYNFKVFFQTLLLLKLTKHKIMKLLSK